MVVRIRLARFGCRNRPFYRLMAADSRSPRDGKHLEDLGYYNPIPGKDGGKRMGLKFDQVKVLPATRSPRIAQARVRLATNTLLQTPHRAGALCTGYWLSIGAQPSDPVESILFRAGILPPPPVLAMAHKGGPRDRHPIDPMTGRPLDIEGLTIVDDPSTSTPHSENGAPIEEVA